MNELRRIVCPDSKPYICLPYGKCYGYDQYCDPDTRTTQPCFPRNIIDEASRLTWCHQVNGNTSLMIHSSCRFACEVSFNQTALNAVSEEYVCSLPEWAIIVITLLSLLVIILLVMFSKMSCRHSQVGSKLYKAPKSLNTDFNKKALSQVARQQNGEIDDNMHTHQSSVAQEFTRHSPSGESLENELRNHESDPFLINESFNLNLRDGGQTSNSRECLPNTDSRNSPVAISVSESDTGIYLSSGSSINHTDCIQQHTSGGQGRNNQGIQTDKHRSPDLHCIINASSPDDGDNILVTNLTNYKS